MRYLLAILISIGVAFAAAPAKPQATKTAKAAKASPAAVPDAALEEKIKQKFAKSKISTNNFQVRVEGGVATLQGRASLIQHKGTATRLAKSAGVKAVVNNIEISPEARQKAAANLEKARKRDKKSAAPVVTRAEVRMN